MCVQGRVFKTGVFRKVLSHLQKNAQIGSFCSEDQGLQNEPICRFFCRWESGFWGVGNMSNIYSIDSLDNKYWEVSNTRSTANKFTKIWRCTNHTLMQLSEQIYSGVFVCICFLWQFSWPVNSLSRSWGVSIWRSIALYVCTHSMHPVLHVTKYLNLSIANGSCRFWRIIQRESNIPVPNTLSG